MTLLSMAGTDPNKRDHFLSIAQNEALEQISGIWEAGSMYRCMERYMDPAPAPSPSPGAPAQSNASAPVEPSRRLEHPLLPHHRLSLLE